MAKGKKTGKKKLTKAQKIGRKAARTKKDKKLAAQARSAKARGKRPSKAQSSALKRVQKKAKKAQHKGAHKGKKKGGKKGGKRGKKKNPMAAAEMTKAQRKAAAKKGAATRKRNEKKRSEAAKKGAKNKKKGGKKGKKSRKGSPEAIFEQTLRTQQRCEARVAKLKREGTAAIGKEKERKAREREKLERQIARLNDRLRTERAAAEEYKKHRRSRGGGGHRKRNPIPNPLWNPIEGWGQGLAAAVGGVVGALLTVGGDRFLATPPLSGSGGTFTDAPAQGDVYAVSAPSTPIWSQIKSRGWKRILWASFNIVAPLTVADKVDAAEHGAEKSFLELWGYVSLAASVVKVTVDVGAKMLAGTAFGMRTFAAESTARSLQASSAASQLPSVTATPGQGYQPTLTGYGKAGQRQVGSGCGCGKQCGCRGSASTLGAMPGCDGTHSTVPGMPQQPPPQQSTPGGGGGRTPVQRNPNPPPSLGTPGSAPVGAQGNDNGRGAVVVDIATAGVGAGKKNIVQRGEPRRQKWL